MRSMSGPEIFEMYRWIIGGVHWQSRVRSLCSVSAEDEVSPGKSAAHGLKYTRAGTPSGPQDSQVTRVAGALAVTDVTLGCGKAMASKNVTPRGQ